MSSKDDEKAKRKEKKLKTSKEKLIRVENGLKERGLDHNILNYVRVVYTHKIDEIVRYTSTDEDGNIEEHTYKKRYYTHYESVGGWKPIVESHYDELLVEKGNVCACKKKDLVYLYYIVHKSKIHDIRWENIIILGSDCIERIIYHAEELGLEHAFGDTHCSALYNYGCGFKKGTLSNALKKADKATLKYYEESPVWKKLHVCHKCEEMFKAQTIALKKVRNKEITLRDEVRTDSGRKSLYDFLNFQKIKKKTTSENWRNWCITLNVYLEHYGLNSQ